MRTPVVARHRPEERVDAAVRPRGAAGREAVRDREGARLHVADSPALMGETLKKALGR